MTRSAAVAVLVAAVAALAPGRARAFPASSRDVPCDPTGETCVLCHDNADGGTGCGAPPCLDPFGSALQGSTWAEIAGLDSDGDGVTNGEELGDPEGAVIGGMGECHCATDPGDPASAPPLDGDGDGVACGPDCDDGDPAMGACGCTVASDCGDGVPCTIDLCDDGVCVNQITTRCNDAGPGDGGGGGGCEVAPRSAPAWLGLLALAWVAARFRSRAR